MTATSGEPERRCIRVEDAARLSSDFPNGDLAAGAAAPPSAPPRAARILTLLLAAALIGAHVALARNASLGSSLTFDEPVYLAEGVLALRERRLPPGREHPPLGKLLAGAPILALAPALPGEAAESARSAPAAEGGLGAQFGLGQALAARATDLEELAVRARLPSLLLSGAILACVLAWTWRSFGPAAGLGALALAAFSPDLLAHGGLATLDTPATALAFSGAWALTIAFERPAGSRAALAGALAGGALLGLAVATKQTAAAIGMGLVPAWALRLLLPGSAPVARAALVGRTALALLGAAAGLVAPYAALGDPIGFLVTAGRMHWNPDYPFYLCGQFSRHGFPHYFLVAFLAKWPPETLLVCGLGAVALVRGAVAHGNDKNRTSTYKTLAEALGFLGPPIFLVAGLSWLGKNTGVRDALPAYPFIFIMGGAAFARPGWLRRFAMIALLLLPLEVARRHPAYLAYASPLAGGPGQLWRTLDDSNLDWGQDLLRLREAERLAARSGGEMRLLVHHSLDPTVYGVRARRMTPEERVSPVPGILYAVSYQHLIRDRALHALWLDGGPPPVGRSGGSILLFRFAHDPDRARAWRARARSLGIDEGQWTPPLE